MGMKYQKIHACPNDCILYIDEFEEMHKCPKCRVSWYKVKDDERSSDESTKEGPPTKVLWYLPIIPRFRRLFANKDDAKDLTWHADGRNYDGMLCHLADSSQWKKINCLYPNFGKEAINLRPRLATDGMNPFGNLSKPQFMACFASNLQPATLVMHEAKIHVVVSNDFGAKTARKWHWCLSIQDLRKLRDKGVDVFDGNQNETFKLRAMVFSIVNDFQTYENLSGYSVKGHYTCPICEEDTSYVQLKHGRKTMYTLHPSFLKPYHPYQRFKKLLMEVRKMKLQRYP